MLPLWVSVRLVRLFSDSFPSPVSFSVPSRICSILDDSVPAEIYCSRLLGAPLQELKLNPYDVRKKCVKEEDGQLCYKQIEWIDEWMNLPEVQAELGVQRGRTFQSMC